jgi:hypothetical protein
MLGLAVCNYLAVRPMWADDSIAPSVIASPKSHSQRVSALEARSFISIEARQATVGEVLATMQSQLKVTFSDSDRIDLYRVVDGQKSGSMKSVLQWLVPNGSFVLIYEEQSAGSIKERRVERVAFLGSGNKGARVGGKPAVPASAVEENEREFDAPNVLARSVRVRAANRNEGRSDISLQGAKPEFPNNWQSEIRSVAAQLQAAASSQLATEANNWASASPADFRSNSDVAQLTLNQETQRAQALAVEQLRALMSSLPR